VGTGIGDEGTLVGIGTRVGDSMVGR